MEILLWVALFVMALAFLIKGADYFIKGAEEVGLYFKLSPFVIGVLLVGIGTSLPEFAGAIAALISNNTEIIVANAVGSNIANILLVIGILGVVAKKIVIKADLLDSELPLFVVSTSLFLGIVVGGKITFVESALLATAFVIYLVYLLSGEAEPPVVAEEKVKKIKKNKKLEFKTYMLVLVGVVALTVGAQALIKSIVSISEIIGVSTGFISLTAVALGTSLPELFVSLNAVKSGKVDMAIGNIFGSNAFNILFTIGIPGLFGTLFLDQQTLLIGVPILAAASFIFFVSGISKRIYRWEGMMFLVFYAFFILKLFGF